jgi:hypothetical protein
VVLPAMIVVATVTRSLVAVRHSVPQLFPDEYIYAALGRSIAHGHLEIRGATVHFPGIFEPLVAAPIWRLFPTVTAYHGVQVENAFAASLAAIPVFLLARWLGLRLSYAYSCALYALVIPELVLAAFTVSDLVAYPLFLAAVVAGVRAIDAPSWRRELAFFALVTLTAATRVQYVALVPAYLIAAVAVERRGFLRTHRLALFATVPVFAVGVVAVVGYYSGVRNYRPSASFAEWILLHGFLFSLVLGVAIVPGAVAGLLRPQGRRETVFAVFGGSLLCFVLVEAALYAANSSQFKERYVFALMPLVPVAFGLYLRNGRPLPKLVLVLSAIIAIAALRLPMTAYSVATFKMDSQFLFAADYLEQRVGAAPGSLVIAVLAVIGSAIAVAVAFRRLTFAALALTFAAALAATAGAVAADLHSARHVRGTLPRDLTWVDDSATGPVTAIAAPLSPYTHLFPPLYLNTSVQREVVLDDGVPTDVFNAPKLLITRDGGLLNASRNLLVSGYGSTVIFANATRVARDEEYGLSLWRSDSRPRLRLVVEGRYFDSWLGPAGRVRAWPLKAGSGTAVWFKLSLPRRISGPVHMKLGHGRFTLNPGSHVDLVCRASGPLDVRFSSSDFVVGPAFRLRSVVMSAPRVADAARVTDVPKTQSCSVVN